jgi:GAF domain-containing protein
MPLPSFLVPEEKKILPFQVYNILSTLLEKEFDELCALASAICQTPVALIKLLEEEKPFIKAVASVPIPLSPDDYVKYAETVAFADDLLVAVEPVAEAVIFYAGIPLINAEGQTMGSLCVVDMEKRSLSDLQTAALKILAGQVMAKLELKKQDIALKKA